MVNLLSSSASATQVIAAEMVPYLKGGQVILLEGDLGTGKTTFTQGLGKALGVTRAIKSPTYTIVKEYDLPNENFRLIHIDAYRLEEGGADSIDLDAYLTSKNVVVIEWAQYLENYLPKEYLQISFKVQEDLNQRQISVEITSHSALYQPLMQRIEQLVLEDLN